MNQCATQHICASPLFMAPTKSFRSSDYLRGDDQHRQTPALSIVQSQPTAAQLHLPRAVLFAKVGDHIALLTIEPPKQRRQ